MADLTSAAESPIILVLSTGKCASWTLISSGARGLSPQRTKPDSFVQWRGEQSGMLYVRAEPQVKPASKPGLTWSQGPTSVPVAVAFVASAILSSCERVCHVLAFICCFGFLLSHNPTECHGEQELCHWFTGQFCFLLMKGLKNDFVRNILWTFEDIHMLVGSNMPIFGGGRYPAVSLRLRWA